MIEATVMGPAEGMASSAGAYWVMTIDGHGFRTTVAVRPGSDQFRPLEMATLKRVGLNETVRNVMVKMQRNYCTMETRTPLQTNSKKRLNFGRYLMNSPLHQIGTEIIAVVRRMLKLMTSRHRSMDC